MLVTHLSIGKRLKTSTFEHREWLIEMAKVQIRGPQKSRQRPCAVMTCYSSNVEPFLTSIGDDGALLPKHLAIHSFEEPTAIIEANTHKQLHTSRSGA
jgi:hypothetical protein